MEEFDAVGARYLLGFGAQLFTGHAGQFLLD